MSLTQTMLLLLLAVVWLSPVHGASDADLTQRVQALETQLANVLATQTEAAADLRNVTRRLHNVTSSLETLQRQMAGLLTCPDATTNGVNWTLISTNCYIIPDNQAFGEDAQGFCERLAPGGTLASIHPDEVEALGDLMADQAFFETWIGLHRSGDSWAWKDGSPLDYTNWVERPAWSVPPKADCVYWYSLQRNMYSAPCDVDGPSYQFLCQLPAGRRF